MRAWVGGRVGKDRGIGQLGVEDAHTKSAQLLERQVVDDPAPWLNVVAIGRLDEIGAEDRIVAHQHFTVPGDDHVHTDKVDAQAQADLIGWQGVFGGQPTGPAVAANLNSSRKCLCGRGQQ